MSKTLLYKDVDILFEYIREKVGGFTDEEGCMIHDVLDWLADNGFMEDELTIV